MISFVTIIAFLATSLVWLAIYNLFFHPLRDYPGPLLCRATALPRIVHRFNGTAIFHAHRLHEQYGFVVRISPNELSYIGGDGWKDIYAHGRAGRPTLLKEPANNPAPPDMARGLLLAQDPEVHSRQRHVFNPAFSSRALKQQEQLIVRHVRQLVANLYKVSDDATIGHKVNMVDMINFTTFDVMADLTFSTPLRLLEQSTYTPWARMIFATAKLVAMRGTIGFHFPFLSVFMEYILPQSLLQKRREHVRYCCEQVDNRLATETDRPDVWTLAIRGLYDGEHPQISREEMYSSASNFMAAGTETTATALSGMTYKLVTHPEVMEKLKREVRSSHASDADFTFESLAALPYLNAVIEETLRLYPPAPEGLPRLTPPQGIDICGKFVPGNTCVFMHNYPAYHSSHNFYSPEAFLPERWLPEASSDPRFARDDKKSFQPFSMGPRTCIGVILAYHEMRLIMSSILWNFDISLCEESKDWMRQKVWVAWQRPPLMVKVERARRSVRPADHEHGRV